LLIKIFLKKLKKKPLSNYSLVVVLEPLMMLTNLLT